jgi:hypothetical protein
MTSAQIIDLVIDHWHLACLFSLVPAPGGGYTAPGTRTWKARSREFHHWLLLSTAAP